MNQFISALLTLCFLGACTPPVTSNHHRSVQTDKKILLHDYIYEPKVKTILFHQNNTQNPQMSGSSVLALDNPAQLVLEFDVLDSDYEDLYVKLIHCESDWAASQISDMDILNEYNEFPINDYEFSFNTIVPYVHYQFVVPRVKLSGNYVLAVYRDGNQSDLLLTKRFMVFENRVNFLPNVGLSSQIIQRNFNQQINFDLKYGQLDLLNPRQDMKVIIRQNYRWDNAINNLQPTFVKENQRLLEYRHFNLENNFKGGNEFRFFDLRSVNFGGQNIGSIQRKTNKIDAFLLQDKARTTAAYGQNKDINGQFRIAMNNWHDATLEGDYINTHFFLRSSEKQAGKVHLYGQLTNWSINKETEMEYQADLKGYVGSLLLKQGWYDYMYLYQHPSDKPSYLEGDHFQTENTYDFLVYYRPPSGRTDLLVGYYNMSFEGN